MGYETDGAPQAAGDMDPIDALLADVNQVMAQPTALDAEPPRIPDQRPPRSREEENRAHLEMQQAMWEPNPHGLPLKEVVRLMREKRAAKEAAALTMPTVAYEPNYASDAARIADYRERGLI